MKHRKKMLQYAQDAQVTDAPWKWWECATKGKDDWETLTSPSQWFACVKYRRKPQWEIDGKFKIRDRVTIADTPENRALFPDGLFGKTLTIRQSVSGMGTQYACVAPYTYVSVGKLALAPQRLKALSKAVGFDVPMPLQEAPVVGTTVYAPRPTLFPSFVQKTWKGHTGDLRELEMGFLHLTAENAEIHAKALAAISSPHFCP